MSSSMVGLARSYLYVPATAGERLARAASRGADAVIVDLEDSVPTARKAEGLRAAQEWLAPPCTGIERWVRVNPGARGRDELAVLAPLRPDGVCLPKVGDPAEIAAAAAVLDAKEGRDCSSPRTGLMPLVESAAGMLALPALARAPRVLRLQLGELDLAADLGLWPGEDEVELAAARSAVVIASAAAGILPPVGAVSPEFRDLVGLRRSTDRLARAGFIGRAIIHPAQLAVVHEAFAVSADQLVAATALVEGYQIRQAAGEGAMVDTNGRMVDEAVVRRCRRTVALAALAERRTVQ